MKKFLLTFLFIKCITLTVNAQEKDSLFIPNVADSLFTVHFTVLQSDTITLNIYNRWGQNVGAPLHETVLPRGRYKISSLIDTLEVNVYVYIFKRNSKKYNGTFTKLDSTGKKEEILNEALKAYPNPFLTITHIEFTLPVTDTVSLDIYNSSGIKVKSYFHKEVLPIGNYVLEFEADSLPSGIYDVILSNNPKDKKMKIVKTGTSSKVDEIQSNGNPGPRIYPNPIKQGNLVIEALQPFLPGTTILVFDNTGRVVNAVPISQMNDKTFSISVDNIKPGIYHVQVVSNESSYMLKFVKQ